MKAVTMKMDNLQTMCRRVMCAQHSPTQDTSLHGTGARSFRLKNFDTKCCMCKTTYNINYGKSINFIQEYVSITTISTVSTLLDL
jgi:hypothetical protein